MSHWKNTPDNINEYFGFVYLIIEVNTGKQYIGKKQFFSLRTKTIPGRKNKKHYQKESNWRTYTGSSKELNEAILLNGKQNYEFHILSLHKTRGGLAYRESELLILRNALKAMLPSGGRAYYNKTINGIKFLPPIDD